MNNLVGRQKSEAHAPLEAAVAISAAALMRGAFGGAGLSWGASTI